MTDFGEVQGQIPDLPEPIRAYRTWSNEGYRLLGQGGVLWPTDEPLKARCSTLAAPPAAGSDWRVNSGGGFYFTSSVSVSFGEDTEEAGPHECPSVDARGHGGYGCGIYAYKTVASAIEHNGGYVRNQVVGCVELGGRVYEHTNGYRAEYALPVALYRMDHGSALGILATVYGVPLEDPPVDVIRDQINAAAKDQAERWDRRLAGEEDATAAAQVAAVRGLSLGGRWPSASVTPWKVTSSPITLRTFSTDDTDGWIDWDDDEDEDDG